MEKSRSTSMPMVTREGMSAGSGLTAIREYLQEKSVWIDVSGTTPNPFVLR